MTEEDLINTLENKKWKDKYFVKWCNLCDTAIISCLNSKCYGSSCNSGGCEECLKDFEEFNKCKTHVRDYLSVEERIIYEKFMYLKQYILETLKNNESEINWKKLRDNGQMSGYSEELFKEELK